MTEHIRWGGELPDTEVDLSDAAIAAQSLLLTGAEMSRFLDHQIRLIGQFWDEVNRLYEEAQARANDPDGFPNFEGGYSCGRKDALIDILELSAKYPFG